MAEQHDSSLTSLASGHPVLALTWWAPPVHTATRDDTNTTHDSMTQTHDNMTQTTHDTKTQTCNMTQTTQQHDKNA